MAALHDQLTVNANPETGIHFGVIPMAKLCDFAYERVLNEGQDVQRLNMIIEVLEKKQINNLCSAIENPDTFINVINMEDDEITKTLFGVTCPVDDESVHYRIKMPDIEGEMVGDSGDVHFIVFRSDYLGEFRPCSPCFPCAGDLTSPDPYGNKYYDVPPEWKL